jgi:tight adherence protein B
MPHEPALVVSVAVAVAVFLLGGNRSGTRRHEIVSGSVTGSRPARAREPRTPMPASLVLDLVAAALDAGAPPSVAVRAVGEALAEAGDPAVEILTGAEREPPATDDAGRSETVGTVRGALLLARTAGVAPASLVRSAAEHERRRRSAAQAVAARRLGVFAVVPLALCLLPAFLVLTIVPVVVDLFRGM